MRQGNSILASRSTAMPTARFSAMPPDASSMGMLFSLPPPATCTRKELSRADTVVSTTMSNMGLEIALKNSGIRMLRANVGDKYVLEEMLKTGATLGGEQSGHIIFRDGDSTTGDGLLTALRLMDIIVRAGKSLADLIHDLKVFPQKIQNIRVREKIPFAQVPAIQSAIDRAERELDGNGTGRRPLLRHGSLGQSDGRSRI